MDPVRSRRFALPGAAAAVLVVAAAWLLAAAPVGAIDYPSSPPVMTPAPATTPTPSASAAAPAPVPSSLKLGAGTNATLGSILTGPNGMTLYTLSSDPDGGSACTGQCLVFWPPLLVAPGGSVTGPAGATGTFATFTRTDDGTTQVTYNGRALYYFKKDSAPGDANGEGVSAFGGVWHVVKVAAATGGSSAVKLGSRSTSLGSVLTGPNGMTVYTLSSDPSGGSSCTGQCLTFWPALTVPTGGSVSGPSSEKGTLSTFVRTDDGTTQVALNGHALYYFVKDGAPGDVNGEGIKTGSGVWHAVKLSAGAVQGATGSPSATLPVTATDAGQGTSGTLLPLLLIALGGLTAVLFAARPIARTMRNR